MAHRTGAGATINPDNIKMFYATSVGVGLVFIASVVISFFGLYAVGLAQGLPPHLAWFTPVMIDVAILVFTMAALIQKRRGNRFARFFASTGVALATIMSVALNFSHSYYTIGIHDIKSATGTIVNAIAPVFIWVTTEMLVALVTKQPPAPRDPSAARKKAPAAKRGASKARAQRAQAAPAAVEPSLPAPLSPPRSPDPVPLNSSPFRAPAERVPERV